MKLKLIVPAMLTSLLIFSSNAHALDVSALLKAAFKVPSKALASNPVLQKASTSIAKTGASQNAASSAAATKVATAVAVINKAATDAGKPAVFVPPAPVTDPTKGAPSLLDTFISTNPAVKAAVKAAIPDLVVTPLQPVSAK